MSEEMSVPPQKLSEYEEAFECFQEDQKIPTSGLWLVLRSIGDNPTETELSELIKKADDGDEFTSKETFMKVMSERYFTSSEKELHDAFTAFDRDGSGAIDLEELSNVLKQLGESLTQDEISAMMAEADDSGDGEIDFAEFSKIMMA